MASLPDKDLQAILGDEWAEVKKRIDTEPRFAWLRCWFARPKQKR